MKKNNLTILILLAIANLTNLYAQDCNLTKQQKLLSSPDRIGYGRNATGGTNLVYVKNESELRAQIRINGNYVCLHPSLANQQIGLTDVAFVGNNITFDGSEAPGAVIFPDYANGYPPAPNQTNGNMMFCISNSGGSNVIFHAIKLDGKRDAAYVEGNQDFNTGGINIRVTDVWMNNVEATGFWDDAFLVARQGDRVTFSNIKTYNTDKAIAGFFPASAGPVDRHLTIHKSDLSCRGISGGQRTPTSTANFVHVFNSYIHGIQYGAIVAESNSANTGRYITENNVYEDTNPAPEMTRQSGFVWSNENHIYGAGNSANASGNVVFAPQPQPFTINYPYTLMNAAEVKNYVLEHAGATGFVTTCEPNPPINPALPTGCPTGIVEDGNISIEEPLPAGGAYWSSSSPFWSCTQNGNNFDVAPYVALPNPNAFTMVALPAANYCCNFEATPLDANGNQLPTVYNQCCFTVGATSPTTIIEAGCPSDEIPVSTPVNLELSQVGVPANASTINFTASVNPSTSGNGNVSDNSYNFTPQQAGDYSITVERCYETSTSEADHRTRLLASPNRVGYGENATGGTNYVYPTNEAEFRYMIKQEGNYVLISADYANTEWGITGVGYIASNVTIDGSDAPGFTLFPDYANGFPSTAAGNSSASILATHREDNIIIHSIILNGKRSSTYNSSDPSYNTGGLNIRSSNVFIDHIEITGFWDDGIGTAQAGDFITISHVKIYDTDKGILHYNPFEGDWDRHFTIHSSLLSATQRNPWNTGAHFVHLFNNVIKDARYGALFVGRLASQGSFRWTGDAYVISENNIYQNNLAVDMRAYNSAVLVEGHVQSVNDNFTSLDGNVTTATNPSLFSINYNYSTMLKNTSTVESYVLEHAGAIQTSSIQNETICELEICAINVVEDTCEPNCNNATIYEAEAATLAGVTKANNKYTNISNGEYVTGFDEDGDQLIFNNVVAAEAGTYLLTIRYACSSYKENYVSVNGGAKENISFPTSAVLTDKTIPVSLNEGNNTITIEKHWGWFDVDYIKLDGTGNEQPPQPGATIRIEAESGVPTGVITQNNSNASAGQYVTNFHDDGDKITVTAPLENAGMYQLKVGYRSSSGEKKNDLYLNGMFLGNIQFQSSNTFTEMMVGDFYFDVGQNTIEFIKSWGWMDVDYFEVVAAANQNANNSNDICERTVEIGYAPTANFYRAGTINSDAVISANNFVEFICTDQINLLKGFTVEKGADFLTDIEECD